MKTLNLKTGTARNLILAILFLVSVNTFADGGKSTNPNKIKTDSNELKEMANLEDMAIPLMNPAAFMIWMIEEVEEELKVENIEVTNAMRPLWNIEAMDVELEVENYKPTEELVPYWMIVEEEAELEVTDLVLV